MRLNLKQMKMKKLKKGEKGFTLIELLIVIAITGLITAGLTTTIMQVLTMSHSTANRMTAVRQVQQAGFWVSPDVQMAQNVTTGASSGFPLTLTWTDPASGNKHEVTYAITPDNKLQRTLKITPQGGQPTTTVSIVAEYINPNPANTRIDPANTTCGWVGEPKPPGFQPCPALNFTVTATVGEQSETRVYEVKPRPGS